MARKQHNLEEVLRSLGRKRSIKITGRTVQILKNADDVGNGSWGKIDYLHKVHGYSFMRVDKFQ